MIRRVCAALAAMVFLIVGGWVDAPRARADSPARAVLSETGENADRQAGQLTRAEAAGNDVGQRPADSGDQHRAVGDTSAASGAGSEALKPPSPDDDTRREVQRLSEENRRLRQTISGLEALQRTMAEYAGALLPPVPASPLAPFSPMQEALLGGLTSVGLQFWRFWHWMLAGFTALLLLSIGAYIVDWRFLRRHGGFRL